MRLLLLLILIALSFTGGVWAGDREVAIFAGGCFWCMQPPFDETEGVISTEVGYIGGAAEDAEYRKVSAGQTAHREAIRVVFNPSKVTYDDLLAIFWRNIDPTQADGQFSDVGEQYKPAIYYRDSAQKAVAETSKKALAESGRFKKPIATTIEPATEFFAAEEYHQKYYKKNPRHYHTYKEGSGRAGFIRRVWGDGEE